MRHLNRRSTFYLLLILFAVASLVVTNNQVSAQGSTNQPPGLFGGQPQQVPPDEHGVSALEVDIIPGVLKNGSAMLELQLPGRGTVILVRDGLERRSRGDVTWRGRAELEQDSRAILTLKGGFVAGKIRIVEDLYEIRPLRGRKHLIQQLDPGTFPGDLALPAGNPPEMENFLRAESEDGLAGDPSMSTDGPNDLHVLVTYSPQARAAASGTAQIEAQIQSAVDSMDAAFIDSDMIARVTLVHTQEIARDDTGSWKQTLIGLGLTRK